MGRRYIELFRTKYSDMASRIGLFGRRQPQQQAPAGLPIGLNPMPFAGVPNLIQPLPVAPIGSQSYPFRGMGGGMGGHHGSGHESGPTHVRMIGLPYSATREDVCEFFRYVAIVHVLLCVVQ